MSSAKILCIGCGGLGGNLGKLLVQMGFGFTDFVDHDIVEPSNLNRQFFTAEDVGKHKAHALIHRLAPFATVPCRLRGFAMPFEHFIEQPEVERYDLMICGIDNVPSMVTVARYGLRTATPVVFINISFDGDVARVFIQRPGEACFACYDPSALEPRPVKEGCPPIPAVGDILQVAIGLGARAAVNEIHPTRRWDYTCRDITFSGFDTTSTVHRRPGCPVCFDKQ